MNMKDIQDARGATSRRRHQALALTLIGTALLLMLAACAPATAPAEPAAQPTAAPAAQAPATAAPAATTAPAGYHRAQADRQAGCHRSAKGYRSAESDRQTGATATEAPKPTEKPAATAAATQAAPPAAPAAGVSFAKDVKPILDQKCAKCHGGEKTEEGLSFKTYADLMKGSDNGAVIKPGSAADSDFVKLVVNGKMPKRADSVACERDQDSDRLGQRRRTEQLIRTLRAKTVTPPGWPSFCFRMHETYRRLRRTER